MKHSHVQSREGTLHIQVKLISANIHEDLTTECRCAAFNYKTICGNVIKLICAHVCGVLIVHIQTEHTQAIFPVLTIRF